MAEQDKTSGIGFFGKLTLIGIAMSLVVIGGASLFLVLQEDASEDFIIIKAETTPIRVKPVERGGADIDHQDSAVLQMLDDIKAPAEGVDRLVLPDANPELPPVSLPEDETQLADENNPIIDISPSPETAGAKTAEIAEAETTSQTLTNDAISDILSKKSNDIADNSAAVTAANQDSETVATPTARPKTNSLDSDSAKAKTGPKIITEPEEFNEQNPPFMVQLAAFRDQLKAEQAAAILTEKHSDRLLSLQLGIMSVDTGSSGVFWRVITEPLPAIDARMICDALKLAGQDCILRPVSVSGL